MTCTKGLLLVKAILSLCRKKLQSTGHTELSGYCADRPCGLASECGALLRPRVLAEKGRKIKKEKEREKKMNARKNQDLVFVTVVIQQAVESGCSKS